MDRAQRLAILNAASDESLAMALQAIGIQDDGMDPYGEEEENVVPKWNDLEVSVPASGRGPIVNKEALFVPKPSYTTNAYGLQEPGDQEAAMAYTGMV